ncbi:uncharacterized Zn finger protein (UPF0148 family) [Flavobacterium arsenatis]|uniref:Uncharacterized Zn finger protein (UPF0148 family) n=1 Tax=Flavobacterium arsenatis TaxID=1484332 RepID=A0ABU1TNC8_9FLAO|nr:hypothetical protein [Flavobacterium arsenatis]MDR6967317.1 uncharacterized Zn finger protein (UPF0148 family) [Flavobacterium arsenatis]
MENNNKPLSLLEKMKQRAKQGKNYGGEYTEETAKMNARTCPNCGAGRAEQDGLTHCAYCSFEFLAVELSDGINIKKSDNSKKL